MDKVWLVPEAFANSIKPFSCVVPCGYSENSIGSSDVVDSQKPDCSRKLVCQLPSRKKNRSWMTLKIIGPESRFAKSGLHFLDKISAAVLVGTIAHVVFSEVIRP